MTKVFDGGVKAVDDVSLEIADGEFMVLVGPSGCGKTTLLRMIAGLEQVSSGRVILGDEDVTDLRPRERDIAMVFQNYALYPHMTVGENLGFALKLRKISKAERARRVGRGRRRSSASRSSSIASPASSRAASANASRWAGRWCASRRRSSWTSRSRTSTRNCATRCASSSRVCTTARRNDGLGDARPDRGDDAGPSRRRAARRRLAAGGHAADLFRRPANLFVAAFIGSPS